MLPAAEVSAVASFLRDTLPSIFGEHILPRASLEHLITVSPVRKALKGELMGDPLYAAGQVNHLGIRPVCVSFGCLSWRVDGSPPTPGRAGIFDLHARARG